VLARVKQIQTPSEWESQLRSSVPYARVLAAEALGDTRRSEALAAVLADASASYDLRRACAEALGAQRATDALLPMIEAPDARLREAVARALGNGVDTRAAAALDTRVRTDAAPDVRAAALEALARLDAPLALTRARAALRTTARREEVRLVESASDVLGAHGTPSDLALLLAVKGPDRAHVRARSAAVAIVARIESASERTAAATRVARAVEPLADDVDLRVRRAAIGLLGEVGDTRTVALLEALRRRETVEDVSQAALDAATSIRSRAAAPSRTPNARDAELDALRQRLDGIEARLKEDHR
jgi:HEAT repeat protein